MLISFASALTLSASPTTVILNGEDDSDTVTITNTGLDGNFNISSFNGSLTFTDSNSKDAVLSITVDDQTDVSQAVFSLNFSSVDSGFLIGEFDKTLVINGVNVSDNTVNDSIDVIVTFRNSFCSDGAVDDGDLKLKVDINNRGEGDDDEWLPLDRIEIEVELKNNKNDDLDDVIFELSLFKEGSNTDIIDDMIWISKDEEEIEVGDVDEDEREKHTFEFRVDPTELDDGDNDYILVVKAFPDGDEDVTCIDFSENLADFGDDDFLADISIIKENDEEKMVVIDKKSYPLVTNAFCGEQVTFSADIYNIGDEDFEDQIKVLLFNNELGLNLEEIVSGDLDEGEKTDVTFSFKIPSDADEKQYTLIMEIFYDYDEDDNVYDEVSDDTFDALFKVEGNCVTTTGAQATVSAVLESGGLAGEELVVKATIVNTGDSTANYVLNAAAYTEWASSADVSPSTVTLSSGESRDVLITLNVKSGVSGEKLFDIEVVSGSEFVVSQPVSVSIESKTFFRGFFTGGAIGSSNVYLWIIGALNVILIAAIIFVVVRLLRK